MNPQNLEARTERRLSSTEVREYLRRLDLPPYNLGDRSPLIYVPPKSNEGGPNLIFYRKPKTGFFIPEGSTADGLYIAVPGISANPNRIRYFRLTEFPIRDDLVHPAEGLEIPKTEERILKLGVNILYMFKYDQTKLPLPDKPIRQQDKPIRQQDKPI